MNNEKDNSLTERFINKQIDNYITYFKKQLAEIFALQNKLYQKIILCTFLDTLAIARFPELNKPGKHSEIFKRLISECTFWAEDSKRISLPQLYYRLEYEGQGVPTPLREALRGRLSSWEYGRIYRLDVDPLETEFDGLLQNNQEHNLLKKSSHLELLYSFRNHLIHESRQPGYGMEISDDNRTPYYHGYGDSSLFNDNGAWELVYPAEFFKELVQSALVSIEHYFKDNNIDPNESYGFSGTRWKVKV